MIRLTLKDEPAGFDKKVRRRGAAFLRGNPAPTGKEFLPHGYWKDAAKDLHAAYSGICAYSCMLIPPPGTVDHFFPKSSYPQLAYEWSNYRLSSHRLNTYKAESTQVIDPFVVQPGWFVLDVPSCLIKPGSALNDVVSEQVRATIDLLKLNADDYLVQERCDILMSYATGDLSIGFLARRYPFLAFELERQGIQEAVRGMLKTPAAPSP